MDTYTTEIPAYIYCHRNLITKEFYFGYRMANIKMKRLPKNDFPKYITSGKIKLNIKQNPHEWHSEILTEFFGNTKEDDAYWAEQALIKEHWGNPLLLNGHYYDKEKNHKIWRCGGKPGPRGPNKNPNKTTRSDKGIPRGPQNNPTGPRGPQKNPSKSRKPAITHPFFGPEQNHKRLSAGTHPFTIEWTCQHCGKSGKNLGSYTRWHGDNCRQKMVCY